MHKEPLNDRQMKNTLLQALDEEIEVAELKGLFNFTDIDLREIEICAPWNDYNPLHFCAFMDKPGVVQSFTEEVERLEDGSAYKEQVQSSTLKAMEFRSK